MRTAATKKSARNAASNVFSAEEKAAMKELIKERKASRNKAEAEAGCPQYLASSPMTSPRPRVVSDS